jgi:hypothetical protein
LAAGSANSFSSVFGAPIHKTIIMSSVESDNEDCNCDVVVLEQPHCNLLHSIAQGDATGETTPMADDDSQTKKSRSALRWMPAAHVALFKDGRNTQAAPFLTDPTNWMDIMLVRQLRADKPFEVAHGKSTAGCLEHERALFELVF